jgi:sirohydrochlorin cobaltochelatase
LQVKSTDPILKLPSAYLLVSHGSRDPRPQVEVEKLAALVSQKLEGRDRQPDQNRFLQSAGNTPVTVVKVAPPLVGTACLELAPLPLHQQIQEFGEQAIASGYHRLHIVPLFLLPGVHVMEDIPGEVAIAQSASGWNLTLDIRPHLGSHPRLGRLFATQVSFAGADAKILLSHGSRRPNGNQPVEALAAKLGAVPAYWSVLPSLEMQVKALVNRGCGKICILPYFLFAGGITDAIAQVVDLLSQKFPDVEFKLANSLGASVELADLILDLI